MKLTAQQSIYATIGMVIFFSAILLFSCEDKREIGYINVSDPTPIGNGWVLMPDQTLISEELGIKFNLSDQEAAFFDGRIIYLYNIEDKSYRNIGSIIELPDSNYPDELRYYEFLTRDKNLIEAPSSPEKTLGIYRLYRAKSSKISPAKVEEVKGKVLCIEYLMSPGQIILLTNLISPDTYNREGDDSFLGSHIELHESGQK